METVFKSGSKPLHAWLKVGGEAKKMVLIIT